METFFITIPKIYKIDDKGGNMTLNEKRKLDEYYAYLPKTQGTYCETTKTKTPYTNNQYPFIRHILPTLVKQRIPKLDQVLAIYGLSLDTIFVWEDDRHADY